MKNILIICIAIVSFQCTSPIEENDRLLENLLKTEPATFGAVLTDRDRFKVQIIYSRIHRDSLQQPSFDTFYFNHKPGEYFYPASTVKLPAALLTLEKLNRLNVEELTRSTPMLTDSAFSGQSTAWVDSTSQNLLPSIGHYIRKILLVSDNDEFNRLYEFLGQEAFNLAMESKGYTQSRFSHRLSIFLSPEENRTTNPIRFVVDDSVIYHQPLTVNRNSISAIQPILIGRQHYSNGKLVEGPMDFRLKNFFPLQEQHQLLRTLFFPESMPEFARFDLNSEDYSFIYKYMSMWPSETTFPNYRDHDDHYVKFFMYGSGEYPIDSNVRIYNKVGQAYGFLIDNAYIVDFDKGIEFMLSAVIYVNENETLNDGDYEYDEIGFPFLAELGQLIYQYELEHPPEVKPDFSHLNR